ncbi:hypothetical protein [Agrococcus pavilionensis]|uniref:hypothetical protein n=1 Tax=Agrococcus pavilionensis TaxID=1346502 RepID=UPI001181B029|nr:hypothetical protein [Agrococcus pavilionensis]
MVTDVTAEEFAKYLERFDLAATRRHEMAAQDLRDAESVAAFDRVLLAHQRKMRAAGEQRIAEVVRPLADSDAVPLLVQANLDDLWQRSVQQVSEVLRAAALASERRPQATPGPLHLDQLWTNVYFALGQQIAVAMISDSYASSTDQLSSPAKGESLAEVIGMLERFRESAAQQSKERRVALREASNYRDLSEVDRLKDGLSNLGGQVAILDEILQIAKQAESDPSVPPDEVVLNVQELLAFARLQRDAWAKEFQLALAVRDVERAECANELLNSANGQSLMADWARNVMDAVVRRSVVANEPPPPAISAFGRFFSRPASRDV